jgi:hypothetical protein
MMHDEQAQASHNLINLAASKWRGFLFLVGDNNWKPTAF